MNAAALLRHRRTLFAAILIALAAPAFADHLPEVLVVERYPLQTEREPVAAAAAHSVPDAASLMALVPGGAQNFNGALSGQMQYRGLFGPRLGVLMDGMRINSGGPNWMDPPLHYLPLTLIDRFEVLPGVTPVASGSGIGGQVRAQPVSSRFGAGDAVEPQGMLNVRGHSADDGYNVGGMLGFGTADHRGHVLFSRDDGGDTDFGGGTIAASSYQRNFYGVGYGHRINEHHELGFEYDHIDTGSSGTPALPLDIDFFDTELARGRWNGQFGAVTVNARVSYSHVDHRMNNFELRPAPDFSSLPLPPFVGTDRRYVDASSESYGFALELGLPAAGGTLLVGGDGHFDRNDARVFDPDFAPFFVANFNQAETDALSFFVDWRRSLSARLELNLGLRYTNVDMTAGTVGAQPAQLADAMPAMCSAGRVPPPPPCAVRALRDRFNAGPRGADDDNVDAVIGLRHEWSETLETSVTFGRKTRSPSYVERFLWIPLEVNSGLGDGNNYVGDVDLDPEVAWQVDVALKWNSRRSFFTPRAFYQRIDDYLQGVAITPTAFNLPVIGVSSRANGDPTPLRFANVDAELWGFDAAFGHRLGRGFSVDGVVTFVRGERRDIDDNLFRIAPPTLRLRAGWTRGPWGAELESVLVARQDRLARSLVDDPGNLNNSDFEIPGYVLLNLALRFELSGHDARILAGVENLADLGYRDPNSGFNRVLGSDVERGRLLPGRGRNGFVALDYRF